MSIVTSERGQPMSSGELQIGDPERLAEVEHKQQSVTAFLAANGYDAFMLQRPSNFSWFTAGALSSHGGMSETTASLFLTPKARVVITSNADSAQLFERELPGLGFQLKERPWYEPRQTLIEDVCRGRRVGSDTGVAGTTNVAEELRALRLPLTEFECGRMRELGRMVAHATEATARNTAHGATEAEIAGEVTHRLIKHQVVPERIQVFADGRAERYPYGRPGYDCVERCGTIAVVGRRWGLHVGVARTFSFGEPPDNIRNAYSRATLTQATGMYFSQADWVLSEVWSRVARIFEKYDCANEWRKSDQAELLGYEPVEVAVVPDSAHRLECRTPVYWHPLVESAMTGDTILVGEGGFELVTPIEGWPKLFIDVKGYRLERPDILRRTV